MDILLTGHAGYIGQCLAKRLSTEHKITGLDLRYGQNLRTIPMSGSYDLIIHLAGMSGVRESMSNPAGYWQNNVEAFQRLLTVFGKNTNTRILYASSSSAAEPDLNPYAASKFCMEQAAKRFSNTLGMRFHTVYNEKPRKGMLIQKIIDDELTYITNHSRDFIHMEDLLDAIELLINSSYVGTIDIGSGVSVPIPSLAPGMPVHLANPGERLKTLANLEMLKKLDYKPKYNVVTFLKELGKL